MPATLGSRPLRPAGDRARGLWIGLALATCACAAPAVAPDERPVPLRGLDPVRLTEGHEVAGKPELALGYGRYRYLFSSPATRERFAQDPERYALQFGGDCARMQGGLRADPDSFAVVDGLIYAFHSPACRAAFVADPEAYLVPVDAPRTPPDGPGAPITDEAPRADTADWPQWGGPRRDFKSPARGLAAAWPASGPPQRWRRALGDGFSSITVAQGVLYTMFRRGQDEVAVALDAATGTTIWDSADPAPFPPAYRMEYGPGPHATPVVAGELVITVGATGHVRALQRGSGRPVWSRDLARDFGATLRPRGYSSSPLVWRDRVIVMAGGHGAGVVALGLADGAVAWRSLDLTNSQSSPILIDVGGQEQVVAFMAEAVVGLRPEDGRALWRVPHATDWGLNASTPAWGEDGLLFVSSAYGGGSRMIRLTRRGGSTTAEELWFTRRMRLHFGNALRLGPYVLGSSGDLGPALFAALDARTGEPVWRERGLAKASFLHADGRLIILDEDGELILARPGTTGLAIDARAQVLQAPAWTVPALAGTTLYVRDRKEIAALELR